MVSVSGFSHGMHFLFRVKRLVFPLKPRQKIPQSLPSRFSWTGRSPFRNVSLGTRSCWLDGRGVVFGPCSPALPRPSHCEISPRSLWVNKFPWKKGRGLPLIEVFRPSRYDLPWKISYRGLFIRSLSFPVVEDVFFFIRGTSLFAGNFLFKLRRSPIGGRASLFSGLLQVRESIDSFS